MAYWQTPEFKAAQKDWYARLKDEGFEDAEEVIAGELVLKQTSAHVYRHHDELGIEMREAYYRLLSRRVERARFKSIMDQLIMKLHASGLKIRHIAAAMKANGLPRCEKTVLMTIRRFEMKWGLRDYSLKQLNKKPNPKSA